MKKLILLFFSFTLIHSAIAATSSSLVFDGSGDYVTCGNDASIQLTGNITVEAWVKAAGTGYGGLASKLVHEASREGYELAINANLTISFLVGQNNTNWNQATSSVGVTYDTWTHVAGTYDGSNIRVYINGTLRGTTAYSNGIIDSGNPLTLGSRGTGNYLTGSLDEVRIWNVVRSETQINDNKDIELTGSESGLVAYYKMNDGSGSTLTDNSTNSNTGTLMGDTYWGDDSLPVELTSFTAASTTEGVELRWTTENEIDNLGFVLERAANKNGPWQEIASFNTHNALVGQGTISQTTNYTFIDNSIEFGSNYFYKLSDVNINGTVTTLSTLNVNLTENTTVPNKTELYNAYPNPFNPETSISYYLDKDTNVSLSIYNILGVKIKDIFTGTQSAGNHNFKWNGTDQNGTNLPSGVYILQLQTLNANHYQNIILLK